MDRVVRILAIVYRDTGRDTSNIIWSIHNEMIIETIFGIVLSIAGGGDAQAGDPASMIYKGLITGNKIIQKEKNKEMDESTNTATANHITSYDYTSCHH